MKLTRTAAVVACVAAGLIGSASAAPIINVYASSAPNAFGSPSWGTYAGNALHALENGLSSYGGSRDTSPTAYERLGNTFTPGDAMVTSFKSWRGEANPTAPFANELGNRLHFGLHILGNGTRFTLQDLTFDISSSDVANSSGFGGQGSLGYAGDFLGLDLNCTTRYGIDWGGDGKGGGNDVKVCGAGTGDDLIDELVYVGVGNALWPTVPGDGATEQEALDNVAALFYDEPIASVTGTYRLTVDGQEYSGSDTVRLVQVPEPATLAIAIPGLVAVGAWTRRRRR